MKHLLSLILILVLLVLVLFGASKVVGYTFSEIVAVTGGLLGILSAFFGYDQWQKVRKKVIMVYDSGQISEILPAWYTARMANDQWGFGLVTTSGYILAIKRIIGISDDKEWIDVELLQEDFFSIDQSKFKLPLFFAPTERTRASVQVSNIVTAIELVTS